MSRLALLLVALAGCRQVLGIQEGEVATDGAPADAGLPECGAQRVVHLAAGEGALGYFTLVWPVPAVVLEYAPTYAYDDPFKTTANGTAVHPIYSRALGSRGVWDDTGTAPWPTVMVAGQLEVHTTNARSIVQLDPTAILPSAAAALQLSLGPAIPALSFDNANPYSSASSAPPLTRVNGIDEAVAAFRGRVDDSIVDMLAPTSAQISAFLPPMTTPSNGELNLARRLAFTVNALRHGLVGTVMIPAYPGEDLDIHATFDTGLATQRADRLATMLDHFYAELAEIAEPACVVDGRPITLANNTVMYVVGDTPRDPFRSMGWPDGNPGNTNWIYVRSNGFLQPGWFGAITTSARQNWNPSTGDILPSVANIDVTHAAWAATLYAIARGDRSAVTPYTTRPYDGVIVR